MTMKLEPILVPATLRRKLDAAREERDERVPVILEARLDDSAQPISTNINAVDQLRHVLADIKGLDIQTDLSRDMQTDRYIFANLRVEQIRRIEAYWDTGAEDKLWYLLRKRLRRIWLDTEVETMLNTTQRTVSADRAWHEFCKQVGPNECTPGKGICWAVIDDGIDANHDHFRNPGLAYLYDLPIALSGAAPEEGTVILRKSFLENESPGPRVHGTHVAGIIAGRMDTGRFFRDSRAANSTLSASFPTALTATDRFSGIAPYAKLVDLVVVPPAGAHESKAFSSRVIQALYFIRKQNEDANKLFIHGANLSLGTPYDVEDYGCGHTPMCDEVDRLVESGVIVVVAAGNEGYQLLRAKGQAQSTGSTRDWQSHQDISICDPGNSELAITVGSTHKKRPLRYGVSYFSSRGPTADGRLKPDLVAPGEKILSANGGDHSMIQYVRKSGTSQAAPHVSGALACLLSQYPVYQGKPLLAKKVLCETCWDLNRERYFQGHGVLDVYRLLESPSTP